MNREQAIALAQRCAARYYSGPFQPHELVVDAIMIAAAGKSMYEDVAQFHAKFGIPVAGVEPCRIPSHDVLEYRIKFLNEEVEEFEEACAEGNLMKMLDALVDIAYVAMGTAHYMRAPFNEAWDEVQRANLERVLVTRENCPPGKQYRKDMVMKPANWNPPELLRIIAEHNVRLRELAKAREFLEQPVLPTKEVFSELVDSIAKRMEDDELSRLSTCSKCDEGDPQIEQPNNDDDFDESD